MFVHCNYRGKGISKIVLNKLEKLAQESGFKKDVLETGIKQTEAIELYQKSGYKKLIIMVSMQVLKQVFVC